MLNNNIAIGTDIEENIRFKGKTMEVDGKLLKRIFTTKELEYSFSQANPEQHLCARFCAKEAVIKALSDLNISDVHYSDIEIFHNISGSVSAKISNQNEINVKLSISHCKTYSTAVALILK